jgi:sirohydrochlorin ferrochelatase
VFLTIPSTGDPLPENPEQIGIIIVDHGSRRRESNEMLHAATDAFARQSAYQIVEAAHMELAEPTIAQAFRRCVERGANRVIVFPYFLSPGRHWTEDIPSLVAEVAASHPDVSWLVTAPFGLHSGMLNIINDRIRMCVEAASSNAIGGAKANCDVCGDGRICTFRDAAKP